MSIIDFGKFSKRGRDQQQRAAFAKRSQTIDERRAIALAEIEACNMLHAQLFVDMEKSGCWTADELGEIQSKLPLQIVVLIDILQSRQPRDDKDE